MATDEISVVIVRLDERLFLPVSGLARLEVKYSMCGRYGVFGTFPTHSVE